MDIHIAGLRGMKLHNAFFVVPEVPLDCTHLCPSWQTNFPFPPNSISNRDADMLPSCFVTISRHRADLRVAIQPHEPSEMIAGVTLVTLRGLPKMF